MKNKVLATLLAVCLFVGLAVPAFADANTLKAIKADKTSVNLVLGATEAGKDTADVTITGTELDGTATTSFGEAKVAIDDIRVATAVAASNGDGKVVVTFTAKKAGKTTAKVSVDGKSVVVTVNVAEATTAASATINGKDTVVAGAGTADYAAKFLDKDGKAITGAAPAKAKATFAVTNKGGLEVSITEAGVLTVPAKVEKDTKITIAMTYTLDTTAEKPVYKVVTKTVTVAKAVAATGFDVKDVTVNKGEVKLADVIKVTVKPANANTGLADKATFGEIKDSDGNATSIVADAKGNYKFEKAGIYYVDVTYAQLGTQTVKITVIDKSAAKLSATKVSVVAGKTATVKVTGLANGETVTVKSADAKIATATVKDGTITVKGVKAGSVKLTVTSSTGATVGTVAVTVKAASTGKTDVPQTGDALVANLF